MAAKFKIQDPSKLLIPGLVALLVVAAFLVGSLWTKVSMLEKSGANVKSATNEPAQPTPQPDPTIPVKADTLNIPQVTDSDHIRGDKNAKLTLIEYSDFECPWCKTFHPTLQQVMSEYEGKIRWVYRHFPWDAAHPQARPAANASECVASLGGNDAFWSFIDQLFKNQDTALNETGYVKGATSVGVNKAEFQSCFSAKQFDSKITDEQKGGEQAGISGTPGGFLLDDKGDAWVIPGAVPYATIKQIIDSALALK